MASGFIPIQGLRYPRPVTYGVPALQIDNQATHSGCTEERSQFGHARISSTL